MSNTSIIKYVRIIAVILAIPCIVSAQRYDFLIISQPQSFPILNKYEQQLTFSELAKLPKFMPAQIIKSNELLSDNYTQAMKISYDNDIYFLPENSIEKISQPQKESVYKLYRNVILVKDTIKIIENTNFFFRAPDTKRTEKLFIPRNTNVVRIFRLRSEYYVLIPGAVQQYGWLRFPDNGDWAKTNNIAARAAFGISDTIGENILLKTNEVNAIYRDLFDVLNKQTRSDRIPPQWEIDRQKETFHLRFSPVEYAPHFAGSNSRYIMAVEYLLLGSEYVLEPSQEDPFNYIIYVPQAD